MNKIKYDLEFRKKIADLLDIKEEEVKSVFIDSIIKMKKNGLDRYMWRSIEIEDLLTQEEKEEQKRHLSKKIQ